MYNIFVGILQSVGEQPASADLSDRVLVYQCGVGYFLLQASAWESGQRRWAAISQFASAIFCMIHLMRTKEEYRLQISKIGFDGLMMKQIIQNGVPSGFQNSVISIANVFVQTNINAFGKMAMAGCGSYSKD